MSGYAKRMMEAAAPWMAANPVPFSGMVRVPRERNLSWAPDREAAARRSIEKLEPEERDAAMRILAESLKTSEDLATLHEDFEKVINAATGTPATSSSLLDSEELLGYALGSWLLSWGHEGYNVFDLSPDFVAAMLLTDPDAIELDEFRLPFRGLLVFLPDGFARDSRGGSFTKVHVCEVSSNSGIILDITASSGSRVLSTSAHADAVTLRGLSAFGSEDEWRVDDDSDRRVLRTLQHIVLGMAAYTASVSGAAVRRGDSRGTRRRPSKPAPLYWDVARTVRIDPLLVRAARIGSREIAFRLKHRHIVRGHYRNQPIGEGRRDRKTIWIAPFWKGPEDGAAIVHTYRPTQPEHK